MKSPRVLVLLSGKRKCGKDFIASRLQANLPCQTVVIRISEPIKTEYAKLHNLSLDQLLSADAYKEAYRADMVRWSEQLRASEPNFFCSKAVEAVQQTNTSAPVWIVSDIRRLSDLTYFRSTFAGSECQLVTVRIESTVETRLKRNWSFQPGIDDCETECGLDGGVKWDFHLWNDLEGNCLADQLLGPVIDHINSTIKLVSE